MEFSQPEKSRFEINEIEIVEEDQMDEAASRAEIHRNLESDEAEAEAETFGDSRQTREQADVRERVRQRAQRRQERRQQKADKKNKYNWAFFLASLFIGLGITTMIEHPIALFIGLGLGFLFFVDPIYEKAMSIIDRI